MQLSIVLTNEITQLYYRCVLRWRPQEKYSACQCLGTVRLRWRPAASVDCRQPASRWRALKSPRCRRCWPAPSPEIAGVDVAEDSPTDHWPRRSDWGNFARWSGSREPSDHGQRRPAVDRWTRGRHTAERPSWRASLPRRQPSASWSPSAATRWRRRRSATVDRVALSCSPPSAARCDRRRAVGHRRRNGAVPGSRRHRPTTTGQSRTTPGPTTRRRVATSTGRRRRRWAAGTGRRGDVRPPRRSQRPTSTSCCRPTTPRWRCPSWPSSADCRRASSRCGPALERCRRGQPRTTRTGPAADRRCRGATSDDCVADTSNDHSTRTGHRRLRTLLSTSSADKHHTSTSTALTHAIGSRRGRVFTAVRLSVYPHDISKTDALGSPNLTNKYSMVSPGNPFILGSKDQRSRSVTKTMPAWAFALLWVLAFSSCT